MWRIPAFTPAIFHDPGIGQCYEDGRMVASVDVFDTDGTKGIVIHEWTSTYPRHGHSTQALQWLRDQGFRRIVANGVGLIEDGVGDIATAYWQRMYAKGLVDVLLDDNGVDITHLGAMPEVA